MSLSEQQLAARAAGIGGSDAPVVAGLSPWKTPLELWQEKLGEASPIEETELMYWGQQLEALIADEFSKRNGVKVARVNTTLVHPDHPWMVGNIDRRIVGEKSVLECKATAQKIEEPVEAHQAQVLHYMALTGAKVGFLAYLVQGRQYLQFRIERDDEAIDALIRIESAFWRHVKDRTPPAAVNLQDVARLYPGDNGQAVIAPDGIAAACYRLAALKTRLKEVEAEAEAEELAIKGAMGEASTLLGADGKPMATWKVQSAKRLDTKALKEAEPAMVERFTHETTSRVFRLKTKEGA